MGPPCGFSLLQWSRAADAGLAGVKSDATPALQPSSAGVQTRLEVQALTGPDTCTYAGICSKTWSGKGDKTKAERDAYSKTGNSPRVPPVSKSDVQDGSGE